MGRNAGARALRDTGSTTGVATAILALISAGTVASLSLVGAHQLAPAISERLRAGEPGAVRAPATVVVTPRAAATAPSDQGLAQRHTAKAHAAAPSPVAVVPALLTQIHPPVTLPPIPVAHPALTTPAVPTLPLPAPPVTPVTVAPATGHPPAPTKPRRHRLGDVVAHTPSRQVSVAVLGEKNGRPRGDNSACGQRAGGDHHDVHDAGRGQGRHNGSGDGCGRGQGQHNGSGNDGGRGQGQDNGSANDGGRGQGQHNGSGNDHGRGAGGDNSGNGHHGH